MTCQRTDVIAPVDKSKSSSYAVNHENCTGFVRYHYIADLLPENRKQVRHPDVEKNTPQSEGDSGLQRCMGFHASCGPTISVRSTGYRPAHEL